MLLLLVVATVFDVLAFVATVAAVVAVDDAFISLLCTLYRLVVDCGSVSQLFNSSLSDELPPVISARLRLAGIFKLNVPSS